MKRETIARSPDIIWLVTREYDGLAGAGGVKDMTRQLAEALARAGRKVRVVLPLYGNMNPEQNGFTPLPLTFDVDIPYVGVERREFVRVWSRETTVSIFLIEAQRFQEKRGVYTYTAEDEAENPLHQQGSGHGDYFAMNVLLQKAAIDLMILLEERPDIIHCQDGHTALLPTMIREQEGLRHYFRNTGMVVTIHNAGIGYHQEVGDLPFAETITGLPSRVIRDNLLDGKFDPFLAASPYALLNTVSENYARELRETDDDQLTGWLGHQLLARGVSLKGVTNGINPKDFDPTKPKKMGLAAGFDPAAVKIAGKKRCRNHLVRDLGAKAPAGLIRIGSLDPRHDLPLFTLIGRLTAQKGVDKLVGVLETLLPMDEDFQVLILGSGSKDIEADLARLARIKKNSGRICVLLGYDPDLALKIYAAGDFFVIPSRYEPCGLTDYIAQLFGNIPIVHHVGGLVKVENDKTGLAYTDHSTAALMGTMQKALRLHRTAPQKLAAIRRQAIQQIHKQYTWDVVVEKYLALYQEAMAMALEQGPGADRKT